MRHFLLAALAILALGATSVDASAQGCWRESILGNRDVECREAQAAARKAARDVAQGQTQADAEDDNDAPQRRASKTRTARKAPALESLTGGPTLFGLASYYWQPQKVAAGGWFNPNAMTAAHKTLPFGTRVRVTHEGNGRSVVVTINDRGPYIAGRIIDLSKAAAGVIGMQQQGVARVRVSVLGR